MKTLNKRGRKPKPYRTAAGDYVNGLRRRPSDGRWELADGRTFSEADEAKAIERFREMTGDGDTKGERAERFRLAQVIDWAYVGRMIRERPQWVAQATGDERIGYLSEIKPPKPLPSFDELEQIWKDHFNKSPEQRRKVIACWADFKVNASVGGIRDITPEAVIQYRDKVYARGISGKSQQNLFTRIRRLITFARDRAVAMEALNKALECLALLTPSETTVTLDPKPIDPADFTALLDAAEGDDRAMLLVCLNSAMYLQEAIDLRWRDIKGDCLVTHRAKTGKCVRVSKLWPETIQALGKVKQRGEFIFYAYHGGQLGIKGAELRFRKLREAAEVQHVTSSQLRDGAYTAAVAANVNEQICKLLAGHRTGISDHYVKRRPSMVAPACDAVHQAYMTPKKAPALVSAA